jgi:hypothetical protein
MSRSITLAGVNALQKFINANGVLSSAMMAFYRTVNKAEAGDTPDIDLTDAIMLQECASVLARSSAVELLSALKGIKEVGYINATLNRLPTVK